MKTPEPQYVYLDFALVKNKHIHASIVCFYAYIYLYYISMYSECWEAFLKWCISFWQIYCLSWDYLFIY